MGVAWKYSTDEERKAAKRASQARSRERNREHIKSANRARMARWRKENPHDHFASNNWLRYGLTEAQWLVMKNSPCSICGRKEHIKIDHCHRTGTVRGPLCCNCNTGIGKFGDDPAMLLKAIQYLEAHQ